MQGWKDFSPHGEDIERLVIAKMSFLDSTLGSLEPSARAQGEAWAHKVGKTFPNQPGHFLQREPQGFSRPGKILVNN
jgi:hypothetical protein